MKYILMTLLFVISINTNASEELSKTTLIEQVKHVNNLQNKVLMAGSTAQDITNLFAAYTDNFTYEHEVYGGVYTREHLLSNTIKFHKKGNYKNTKPRYKILKTMVGLNAVAISRLQRDGATHLSVFEFKGNKVSRIIEYWK